MKETSEDFIFAWKASKFITHWKRLSGTVIESLELLESRLKLLGKKAGPILFQLPPNFQADLPRLNRFLKVLPRRRCCFEFRHESGYVPSTYRLLKEYNAALCISDHHDAPAPWRRTADFLYIRGHGPTGRYKGHYSQNTLSSWSRRIRAWRKQGYDVYVYFDNDQKRCGAGRCGETARPLILMRRPWGGVDVGAL